MRANEFFNAYKQGYARVAALSLPVHAADPLQNAEAIADAARELAKRGVALVAAPELSITGYALDDLFLQPTLLCEAEKALYKLAYELKDLPLMLVVGAPLRIEGNLYNCAVVISEGRLCGVVPKTYLPNYGEFYEKRYFAHGFTLSQDAHYQPLTPVDAQPVPVGKLLFTSANIPGLVLGLEVCEDMWVPQTPGSQAALAGANVLVNISGSPVTVGRARQRELLVQAQSLRALCAYVYAAAGAGESSNDLAWDGQTMIYALGEQLCEGPRFAPEACAAVADVPLWQIETARLRDKSFGDCATRTQAAAYTRVQCANGPKQISTVNGTSAGELPLLRPAPQRFPFVPADKHQRDQDCYEAYNIQVSGLMQRLTSIGSPKLVIGISGGLDSTHALLVAAQAMDKLGRPRTDILAYTLPGFATSDGTKTNAHLLCESLGVPCEEIDIRPLALQMLRDLGHPAGEGEEVYDVTFENVQAGLRTDLLFRLANAKGGIVLGTGDLSELALGWCTYGVGDQMSHYGINVGVPKTLIQHLIRWVAEKDLFGTETGQVLEDILNTEISPELVPVKEGEQIQSTQATIGPYELHDFFLYHFLRGASPSQLLFTAFAAWGDGHWAGKDVCAPTVADPYTINEIAAHLRTFTRRFFNNQFKRTCIPNGPKVSSGGALSPRGDWRMPSDASQRLWISQLDQLCQLLGL